MNQPPVFRLQLFATDIDGVVKVAAGYELFTYESGTTTEAPTYQDQAGSTPNTNPIVLDAEGSCSLWMDPNVEYTFALHMPAAQGGGLVWSQDDITGAAGTTTVVTSVNGQTGEVTLDASHIEYFESTGLSWLTATTVEEALDQIAERTDVIEAENVTVADTADHFTGDDPKILEDVLAQLGSSQLPSQATHAGKALVTNGSAVSWQSVRTSWTISAPAATGTTLAARLPAGTYQVTVECRATVGGDGYSVAYSQEATVGAVTVTASLHFSESGGFGSDQSHGSAIAVGTLIVGADADYTIELKAASTGGATGLGGTVRVERVA